MLAPAKIVANPRYLPNPDDGLVEDAIQQLGVTPRARRGEMSLLGKVSLTMRWLPGYAWQRAIRRVHGGPVHLIVAVADHFEPSFVFDEGSARARYDEQERRLDRWCREHPITFDGWREREERSFVRTYFALPSNMKRPCCSVYLVSAGPLGVKSKPSCIME